MKFCALYVLKVWRKLNEMKKGSYDLFNFLLKYFGADSALCERISGARCQLERLLLELSDTVVTFQVNELLIINMFSRFTL